MLPLIWTFTSGPGDTIPAGVTAIYAPRYWESSSTYIDKQPREKLPIVLSFVYRIPTGDSLSSSCTVLATAISTGDDASSLLTTPVISSPEMSVTMHGGSDGEDYKLSFLGLTDAGYEFEYDVVVQCREL